MGKGRSGIERAALEYRQRLLDLEATYLRDVGPARRRAEQRLRDAAGRFLEESRAAGLPNRVTKRYVSNLAGWRRLQALAERELDAFTTEAVRAIEWRIAEAAQQGVDSGRRLTNIAFGESANSPLAANFGQVNIGAVEQLIGQLQASSPLSSLPNLVAESVDVMRTELVRGMANGTNSKIVGRRIAKAANIPAHRAATIARTEMHRAYREANRMQYQANSMVNRWRWVAGLSPRTCAACWAMHGQIFDTDEPMGTHPNCRCSMVPMVNFDRLRAMGIDAPDPEFPTGAELFAKETAESQRRILGADKYAAFKKGDIGLNDVVKTTHTEEWGTTRTVASKAQALRTAS